MQTKYKLLTLCILSLSLLAWNEKSFAMESTHSNEGVLQDQVLANNNAESTQVTKPEKTKNRARGKSRRAAKINEKYPEGSDRRAAYDTLQGRRKSQSMKIRNARKTRRIEQTTMREIQTIRQSEMKRFKELTEDGSLDGGDQSNLQALYLENDQKLDQLLKP